MEYYVYVLRNSINKISTSRTRTKYVYKTQDSPSNTNVILVKIEGSLTPLEYCINFSEDEAMYQYPWHEYMVSEFSIVSSHIINVRGPSIFRTTRL